MHDGVAGSEIREKRVYQIRVEVLWWLQDVQQELPQAVHEKDAVG